ncbi:AMP-binding protein [Ottowia flava]|uniref:AMP-binding protein n=1 Tax=Ottowia flava TaxID=2675430 RepID=A0ABW4KM97_9BURK
MTTHALCDVLVYGPSGPITVETFCRQATQLADRLPPGRHVLNTCQDRYLFMLGLAAALMDGRPTLMPSSFTPGTLKQIQLHYADVICLHDGHQQADGIASWQIVDEPPGSGKHGVEVPSIPVDQVAAIVFTSGSTGEPTAHVKRWGRLGINGASEAQRLRSAGHTIVATVPAQHMYGFESSVLLALHGGSSLWRGRPFYPADIQAALEATPRPRMLVTTPFHLSNVVNSGNNMPPSDLLLCATAPLSTSLASAAESLFQSSLFEIYGCTESGQVASRRTTAGPTWQLLPGLDMTSDGDQAWVSGGHVEGRVALTDHIAGIKGDYFELGGRHADMVNIAGKRASIGALSTTLRSLVGVDDGCFLLPDAGHALPAEGVQRLAALVVAPSLSEHEVLALLRREVDAAFLPRPLLKVDALPRNATGKLLATEIQALYRRVQTKSDRQ